jgi:prevent-host-death family protein
MVEVWQAAAARHQFSELVDAAVEGRPQFIRRRDGREVVVVSREYFEQTKPNLKSVLLSYRFGERGDALDRVLAEARATLGSSLRPREAARNQTDADDPGHGRPERTAPA